MLALGHFCMDDRSVLSGPCANIPQYGPHAWLVRGYYHMTRTAPRAISLENHKRKGPV